MKSFNYVVCLVLAVFLTGCSGTSFYKNINRSMPYLRGSSAIVTRVVLSEAVSKEDQKKRAKTIMEVASLIEEMTKEGDLSLETFGEKVSNFVPDEEYWHEFSAAIILLYADFHARAQELEDGEKQKILLQALNKIASGCKIAAQSFD